MKKWQIAFLTILLTIIFSVIRHQQVSKPETMEASRSGNHASHSGHMDSFATAALASPPASDGPPAVSARILQRQPEDLPAGQKIGLAGLKARRVPPKEPLRIPAGKQLMLTVKIVDNLSGRAGADGRLVLHTANPDSFQNLSRVTAAHELSFQRIHSVSDEQIAELCRRAAANTGETQADLAAHLQIIIRDPDRERVIAIARELHELPEVEYAELASLDAPPPPPAEDIAPVTPLLVSYQDYRGAATGVNVDYVWNTYGIRGVAELRITDCEYMFNPAHEDLSGLVELQPNVVSMHPAHGDDHGTAVLGVITSAWNNYGTTGIVPECTTRFYPEYSTLTTGMQYRAATLTAAFADSSSGDIVVMEMQTDGPASGSTEYVPAEYDLTVWNIVKTGSNAGIITVAAAGNGGQNLDGPLFNEYNARGDSGAIIVGSATSGRARRSSSCYGARVNVQGLGETVFTTGYGSFAAYGDDVNQGYTKSFRETSAATAVISSAVALLQSTAIRISGIRLTPAAMRSILTSTGHAQTGQDADTAHIGPLPELQAATTALFTLYPPTFSTLASWGHYHFAIPSPDLTADDDDDGLASLMEYILGTDPTGKPPEDKAFMPRITTAPDGQNESRWTYEFHQPALRTGASWAVLSSATLLVNNWQPLVHGANGISIIRDGDTVRASGPVTAGTMFLRLQVSAN
ncbi:MAG: S8 family serine peptidase [Armatimonadetes bacterium]|nr:S8 family serine peptidase [Akkermansiaceae bacterium]